MEIDLIRLYRIPIDKPKQLLGEMYVFDKGEKIYSCKTVEYCGIGDYIKEGSYTLKKDFSPIKGFVLSFDGLEDKYGNAPNIGGCMTSSIGGVEIGEEWKDSGVKGHRNTIGSKKKMTELERILKKGYQKEIPINIKWRGAYGG